MPDVPYLTHADVAGRLTWMAVVDAIDAGHRLPRARLADQFLTRRDDTLLSRAAWIDGLGAGVKTVTVVPGNAARGLPSVQGAMLVFDDVDGTLAAILDSDLVTWWKTAADSVLAARHLARPDSRVLLVVGAGVVAGSLVRAYREVLPGLDTVLLWNRTASRAEELAARLRGDDHPVSVVHDLPDAVGRADVVATATFATEPVLRGAWVRPGTHVDLVGAFRADMREADDELLRRGRVFVDSRETTLEHIGELLLPLRGGVLSSDDVLADHYDLAAGHPGRTADEQITVCKNGGGAHLDLMTARAILAAAGDSPRTQG